MKSFCFITTLFVLMITSSIHAQSAKISYEPRIVDFPDPVNVIYPASQNHSLQLFDNMLYMTGADTDVPVIIRIPVCFTAFFCKMEVVTQQAFGIMLKVHAGDYDSYMDQKIPR